MNKIKSFFQELGPVRLVLLLGASLLLGGGAVAGHAAPLWKNAALTALAAALFFLPGCLLLRLAAKRRLRLSGEGLAAFALAWLVCSCLSPTLGKLLAASPLAGLATGGVPGRIAALADALASFFDLGLPHDLGAAAGLLVWALLLFALTKLFARLLRGAVARGDLAVSEREQLKTRSVGIDALKAVGALFVMTIHGYLDNGYYDIDPTHVGMPTLTLVYTLLLCCVPLFMTATGYLLSHKRYSRDYLLGWFKYYVAFVVIELFALPVTLGRQGLRLSFETLLSCLSFFGNGYFSMLFGVYLLAPALNTVYHAQKTMRAKLCLIGGLLFLTIGQSVLGRAFTRYWVPLSVLCFYLLGAFLREYRVKLRGRLLLPGLACLSLLETLYILSVSVGRINAGFFWNAFNNYENTYFILPTFLLTFLLSAALIEVQTLPRWLDRFCRSLSVHSLELYLISSLVTHWLLWPPLKKVCGYTMLVALTPAVLVVETVLTWLMAVPIKKLSDWLYRGLFPKKAAPVPEAVDKSGVLP